MLKHRDRQQFQPSAHEKIANSFLHKYDKKQSEIPRIGYKPAQPQTASRRLKVEAIGLARLLCALANMGLASLSAEGGTVRRNRNALLTEGFKLLRKGGWQPQIKPGDLLKIYGPQEQELIVAGLSGHTDKLYDIWNTTAEVPSKPSITRRRIKQRHWPVHLSVDFIEPVPVEIAAGLRATVLECRRLAEQVGQLVASHGQEFVIHQHEAFKVSPGPKPGQLQRLPLLPLGQYADIFTRVVFNPYIDIRFIGQCDNKKCSQFFYRPRLTSHTCSSKCQNAFTSRVLYDRQKQAFELCVSGKSEFQIARIMGVSLERVKAYLKVRQPGDDTAAPPTSLPSEEKSREALGNDLDDLPHYVNRRLYKKLMEEHIAAAEQHKNPTRPKPTA